MQSILCLINWDTTSNYSVGPPLCDRDSHTHTHTLSESLSHFSNPAIQYPFLLFTLSSILPSILPFSSFSILPPSIYPPYSFYIHLLWTDFLLFADQSLTLISPHPLPFSLLCDHPFFLSFFTEICSVALLICSMFDRFLGTFLPFDLHVLVVFVPTAHLFSLFVSLCLFYRLCISTANLLRSPQILRQFSPGSTWPPSLSHFHSHCTMSLLATAITVYHYLEFKVTSRLLSIIS